MVFSIYLKRLAALTLIASILSCNATPQPNQPIANPNPRSTTAKPLVVATNTVLCNLTQQIAADTINLRCLVDAGTDPHVYQPTPNDRKAIETANLILYGGYGFEPQLIKLIQASSNLNPKVAVDELAVANPQRFSEEGETVIDPHVWHDAQNGIQIVKVIEKALSELVPDRAQGYSQNTQKVTTEISQINLWIKSQIATIPTTSRKLVTTHDALGYYSKAYKIPLAGALSGINTEESPTPQRVKSLVSEIKTTGVPTIFAETSTNPSLIQTVAREANVKVSDQELFADGLGVIGSDGDTYQKMLIANTRSIVQGLGGTFTPFNYTLRG
jgi:manganese/iron transport system substrate-binding protein